MQIRKQIIRKSIVCRVDQIKAVRILKILFLKTDRMFLDYSAFIASLKHTVPINNHHSRKTIFSGIAATMAVSNAMGVE